MVKSLRGTGVLLALLILLAPAGCQGLTGPRPTPEAVDAMVMACWEGEPEKVASMLDANQRLLEAPDDSGYIPLMAAAEGGEFDVVKLLLERGARVDVTYRQGRVWPPGVYVGRDNEAAVAKVELVPHWNPKLTPLHYVAAGGRTDVVKLMIDAGADPRAADSNGETPLIWAAQSSPNAATVRLLHSTGATASEVDEAIFRAALANNRDAVTFLQSVRPDPDAPYAFWKPASGVDPDRMNARKGEYLTSTVYRTLWKRGDEEYLVCIRYPGMELFGTPYIIDVFDRRMKQIKSGATTMQQDHFPYALVEIRSESPSLPEKVRGKWILCIANIHWDVREETCDAALDMTKPRVLVAWDHPWDEKANYIPVEVIKWNDEDVEYRYGSGNTSELDTYQLRWAETGPDVFDRMLENYRHHPTPK